MRGVIRATADSAIGFEILSAVDPNLTAIRASGKKIIQYHGWADAAIPARYSIAYHEA